jgi:outer membrane cobalamin receptor
LNPLIALAQDATVTAPAPAPTTTEPATAEPKHAIEEISLEDLLSNTIEVTAARPQNLRESVGVITVITHDEIVRTGARDLIDVLMRVPGFQIGLDILNITDVGFRGMWGHEGKVLLMIDGIVMNELMYGTNQLGNHYPVDQIERIEIIRGPGSVIYGGAAELAVINVITRDAASIGTAQVMAMYGQTAKDFERRDISLQVAHVFDAKHHFGVTLGAFLGQGNRTDKDYTDIYQTSTNLNMQERNNPHYVNFGLTYEKLKVRIIYDYYHTNSIAGYDALLDKAYLKDFTELIGAASYEHSIDKDLTLTPYAQYAIEQPWNNGSKTAPDHSDTTETRFLGGLTASWNALTSPTANVNILVGVSGYHDHGHDNDPSELWFGTLADGVTPRIDVYYNDYAGFAQGLYDGEIGHFALGARYEHQSGSSQLCPDGSRGCATDVSSFVPRAAFTRVMGDLHFKALAAQAFRAPITGDYSLQQTMPPVSLRPEKTTTYEVEFGYKLKNIAYAAVNVFDTTIKDPIVYDNILLYKNFPQTGSIGAEATIRVQQPRTWAELTYSYYLTSSGGKPTDLNQVSYYDVPGHTDVMLGFATHKLTLTGNADVAPHISVSPTIVFLSTRYGFNNTDAAGNPTIASYSPEALINVFAMYHDLGMKDLDLGVGLYNLLDQRNEYIQAYNSYHAPVPNASREILVRLSYQVR